MVHLRGLLQECDTILNLLWAEANFEIRPDQLEVKKCVYAWELALESDRWWMMMKAGLLPERLSRCQPETALICFDEMDSPP
jgi:hypothetical protein